MIEAVLSWTTKTSSLTRRFSTLAFCLCTAVAAPGCDMENMDPSCEEPGNGTVTRISRAEVEAAQKVWGDGIVAIGKAFTDKKDHKAVAANHVDTLYAYDLGPVLFKPTKAAVQQFRLNRDDALSYFVTGGVAEDKGFALQPWTKVRFENADVITGKRQAIAMGNYYFTDAATGKETKVEYTFGYIRNAEGKLVINVHHSAIPYPDPKKK